MVVPIPSIAHLRDAAWHKSSYSGGGGDCVEACHDFEATHGLTFVRDSKDPSGPVLTFAPAAWAAFTEAAGSGKFRSS
ncbi:DUF397 domain-containing protein [Kitasatospora sp. NPDC004531]